MRDSSASANLRCLGDKTLAVIRFSRVGNAQALSISELGFALANSGHGILRLIIRILNFPHLNIFPKVVFLTSGWCAEVFKIVIGHLLKILVCFKYGDFQYLPIEEVVERGSAVYIDNRLLCSGRIGIDTYVSFWIGKYGESSGVDCPVKGIEWVYQRYIDHLH